jgi:hypothetical protein
MGKILYVILGLVVLLVGGLILLAVFGAGSGALWGVTGIFHLFKPEDPAGANDSRWGRDQGREPGVKDDPSRHSE